MEIRKKISNLKRKTYTERKIKKLSSTDKNMADICLNKLFNFNPKK